MPTAPVYQTKVPVEQFQPTATQDINVSPAVYGAGIGQGMQNLGGQVEHVGAIMRHEEEKVKSLNFAEQQAAVEVERQNILKESSQLQGAQWQGKADEYNKRFTGFIQNRAQRIVDPQVRANFLAHNSVTAAALDTDLYTTQEKNMKAYANANYDASIDGGTQTYVQLRSNQVNVGDATQADVALGHVIEMVRKKGQANELPPALIENQVKQATSKANVGAIEQLIANNQFDSAERLLAESELLPDDKTKMDAKLSGRREQLEISAGGMALSSDIYGQYKNDFRFGVSENAVSAINKWEAEAVKTDNLAPAKAREAIGRINDAVRVEAEKTRVFESEMIGAASGKSINALNKDQQDYLTELQRVNFPRYAQLVGEINAGPNAVLDNKTLAGYIMRRASIAVEAGDTVGLKDLHNQLIANRHQFTGATSDTLSLLIKGSQAALDKSEPALKEAELMKRTDYAMLTYFGQKDMKNIDTETQYGVQIYVQDQMKVVPDKSKVDMETINGWVNDYFKKSIDLTSSGFLGSWAAERGKSKQDVEKYNQSPVKSDIDPIDPQFSGLNTAKVLSAEYANAKNSVLRYAKANALGNVYVSLRNVYTKQEIEDYLLKAAKALNKEGKPDTLYNEVQWLFDDREKNILGPKVRGSGTNFSSFHFGG